METYQVYKIKNGSLETMGQYIGNSPQDAINVMAKRGELVGKEWNENYLAIPISYFLQKYKPIVE